MQPLSPKPPSAIKNTSKIFSVGLVLAMAFSNGNFQT
jgi:hypothetical protein